MLEQCRGMANGELGLSDAVGHPKSELVLMVVHGTADRRTVML
jgi:hypothetical protein